MLIKKSNRQDKISRLDGLRDFYDEQIYFINVTYIILFFSRYKTVRKFNIENEI